MQFDHTKHVAPRSIGEVIRRVKPILDSAGTAGHVNGVLLGEPFVDVRLTHPCNVTVEELTDVIRTALGDGIHVSVGIDPTGPHASAAGDGVLTERSPIDALPWDRVDNGMNVRDRLIAEELWTVGEVEAITTSVLLERGFSVPECAIVQRVLVSAGRAGG